MIVTFYSFKGGVGRSMALANVAEIIANLGYDGLAIDWDLEAPGLERYFAPSRAAAEEWTAHAGLIDLLDEYKQGLRAGTDVTRADPAESPGEKPTGLEIIATGLKIVPVAADYTALGSMSVRRPASFARETPPANDRKGRLRLLTAGKRYGAARTDYVRTIQRFDWQEFYSDWAGASYFEFFRRDLFDDYHGRKPDVVLIDSRTGVTEQGGVCTHHLADLVVLLTAANDLNLDGTEWMAKQLSRPELVEMRGNRRLDPLPVATRIEQTAQTRELARFQRAMEDRFDAYLPSLLRGTPFFTDTEIPYIPYYSFEERIAARESETERNRLFYRAYEALAENVVRWGEANQMLTTRSFTGRSWPTPGVTPAGKRVITVTHGPDPDVRHGSIPATGIKAVEIRHRAEGQAAVDALRVAWNTYSAVADAERVQTASAHRSELAFSLTLAVAAPLACLPLSSVVPPGVGTSSAFIGSALIATSTWFAITRSRSEAGSGRPVAEAVKSECYRYAAQIPPYEGNLAPQMLLEFLHHVNKQSALPSGLATGESKTALPPPPMPLGSVDYVARRIDVERKWLRDRAVRLSRLEFLWNSATLISLMTAMFVRVVPWSLGGVTGEWATGFTSMLLVLALLMLAHVRQRRFRDRAKNHLVTAERLEMLAARWSIVSDPTPRELQSAGQ